MAAKPPRAWARSAERSQLRGNLLVGPTAPLRAVPRAAIGVRRGIGRLGERPMHLAAVQHGRRSVDGRAHQRMPEPHPRAELDQTRRSAPARPRPARAQAARPRATTGSRRRPVPPPPRAGVAASRPAVTRFAAGSSARCGPPAPLRPGDRNLRRAPPRRGRGQLEQSERVAASLGDDPVADLLVDQPREPGASSERASLRLQPLEHELRQAADTSLRSRVTNTIATDSAKSRRATKVSVSADSRRATAHRPRRIEAAARRPHPRAGRAPRGRRRSDPAARRR